MAVNGGVVLCLRRGIRFQRYVKYKAKIEPNFGGGEKRIILRHTQDKDFRGKNGGMEAGVLAAEGRATPLMDARLRGQDGGVSAGSCHGRLRVAGAEGVGKGEVSGGYGAREWARGSTSSPRTVGRQAGKGNHEGCPYGAGCLRCIVGGGCFRAGGDQPTPQHDSLRPAPPLGSRSGSGTTVWGA